MKNLILFLSLIHFLSIQCDTAQVMFPTSQPENANFNRPLPDEILDVSPPGFCWWRAAPKGEINYRLRIQNASGMSVYQSGLLGDPVHVPDKVLPPGDYRWFVDALDNKGRVITTRTEQGFSIAEQAFELPWIDPGTLLGRVPEGHPRLLFPGDKLEEIRASLGGSRKEAYEDIRKLADEAMSLETMAKPDFDKYDRKTEYPARRTAYQAAYHEFTRVYNQGMVPMAMMWQLSGEERYGLRAKRHLLNLLDWELEGIASLEEGFDEIGLRIARTAAQGYDWLYDLLSPEEREAVRSMLLARGDQMLARLERRDFLFRSAYSHDGRLPGYLLEFSIALAEEERAEVWMDYAMRALLTVFPHWGDKDGGWAEGINYVLSYNERFITPFQSLYEATGYDLWQKSYFRNMRSFIMYCVSPLGEISPFGDGEHNSVQSRAGDVYSILFFHSLRYHDPVFRWWIEQLRAEREITDRFGAMHRVILEDDLVPVKPVSMLPDRIFTGAGWAALHSDMLNPEEDLLVLFKSSPYGPVSHSHADQNGFAIMKGGKALANPSGARYPQHGSPFHFQYSNLTVAHNALLINGEGQIDRDASAGGRLVDFKSTAHLGYVAGDAQKCYGERLDFYQRHMVLIRPSVILVIDDLSGARPFSVNWLMHCREKMRTDPGNQVIESSRCGEGMRTRFLSMDELDFSQTNEWPIDPKQDYPMVTAEPPPREWHFSAGTPKKANRQRIAAIMVVGENGDFPGYELRIDGGIAKLQGDFGTDRWSATIRIDPEAGDGGSLLELEYVPAEGEKETIRIPE